MKNITALVCMVFIIVTMISCSDMEPAGMTEPPSISGSAAKLDIRRQTSR